MVEVSVRSPFPLLPMPGVLSWRGAASCGHCAIRRKLSTSPYMSAPLILLHHTGYFLHFWGFSQQRSVLGVQHCSNIMLCTINLCNQLFTYFLSAVYVLSLSLLWVPTGSVPGTWLVVDLCVPCSTKIHLPDEKPLGFRYNTLKCRTNYSPILLKIKKHFKVTALPRSPFAPRNIISSNTIHAQ